MYIMSFVFLKFASNQMYMIESFDFLFEIEQSLYKTRLISNTSLKDVSLKGDGLHIVVMYRIEKHKNYHITSLLKYAKILNRKIFADNILIDSVETLGELLKSKRLEAGLSLFKASSMSGIIPKSIIKIERGREYTKSTLVKYISIFPINFTIK